jgi:hypothetical protein
VDGRELQSIVVRPEVVAISNDHVTNVNPNAELEATILD